MILAHWQLFLIFVFAGINLFQLNVFIALCASDLFGFIRICMYMHSLYLCIMSYVPSGVSTVGPSGVCAPLTFSLLIMFY